MLSRELERWIRDALGEGGGWWDVRGRLRSTQPQDAVVAQWHVAAFDYIFVWDEGKDHPFFPTVVLRDGSASAPSLPDGFPVDARDSLQAAFRKIANPLLRARYGDLLWIMRHGERPDLFARTAVDAYLKLLRGDPQSVEAVDIGRRALGLAQEVGDSARLRRAARDVGRAARASLEAGAVPGIGIGFVQLLADLPTHLRPPSTLEQAQHADHLYGSDPFLSDETLEVLVRLTPANAPQLRETQMQRWLAAATAKTGIAKLEFLRRAREAADRIGRRDYLEDVDRAIQAIPQPEMGMREVSAEVKLPRRTVDAYIASLVGETSYEECLARIGSQPAAAGDQERTAAAVANERSGHPLSFLVTRVIQDVEGNVIWQASSDAEHDVAARYRQEALAISISGVFVGEALELAAQRFGLPSIEELTVAFMTPLIPEEDARLISEAIHLHHEQRYAAAAHLLVPRIERVVRRLLRELGQVVTDFPSANRRGGVKGLGTLLAGAGGLLPEALRVHLIALLTEPLSANLRNRIAHGLVGDTGMGESAVLIDAVARLRLLRLSPTEPAVSV